MFSARSVSYTKIVLRGRLEILLDCLLWMDELEDGRESSRPGCEYLLAAGEGGSEANHFPDLKGKSSKGAEG